MSTNSIIIFSGFNQRAIIAFIRTLETHDIDYAIIAKSTDDEIFLTKYRNRVFSIRNTNKLDIADIFKFTG